MTALLLLDTLNLAGTYNQSNFALTNNSGNSNGGNGMDVVYTASSAVTTLTVTVETSKRV